MDLKLCYDERIELKDYLGIIKLDAIINDYTFDNGFLNGDVLIKGVYRSNTSEEIDIEKIIPFTIMLKNNDYKIESVKINDFKYYDIVNNGVECFFQINVIYDAVILKSDNSIETISGDDIDNKETLPAMNEVIEEIEIDNEKKEDFDKEDVVINEIKDKYDKLLDSIFLNRENSVSLIDKKENVMLNKFVDSIGTYRVYYTKEEKEIEKICKEESVSINAIYNNNYNKDFQEKKRIIIKK